MTTMKIKVADLKTNLSRYLRRLRETGEAIEVCVREEPVAYITSVDRRMDSVAEPDDAALHGRLQAAGLLLVQHRGGSAGRPDITTSVAGDGRTDISTVKAVRNQREW